MGSTIKRIPEPKAVSHNDKQEFLHGQLCEDIDEY